MLIGDVMPLSMIDDARRSGRRESVGYESELVWTLSQSLSEEQRKSEIVFPWNLLQSFPRRDLGVCGGASV